MIADQFEMILQVGAAAGLQRVPGESKSDKEFESASGRPRWQSRCRGWNLVVRPVAFEASWRVVVSDEGKPIWERQQPLTDEWNDKLWDQHDDCDGKVDWGLPRNVKSVWVSRGELIDLLVHLNFETVQIMLHLELRKFTKNVGRGNNFENALFVSQLIFKNMISFIFPLFQPLNLGGNWFDPRSETTLRWHSWIQL